MYPDKNVFRIKTYKHVKHSVLRNSCALETPESFLSGALMIQSHLDPRPGVRAAQRLHRLLYQEKKCEKLLRRGFT